MMEKATMVLYSEQMPGPYVDIRYYVRWQNPDGTVREPEERKKDFLFPGIFTAGGKPYSSLKQLCAEKLDEDGHICRDVYGRDVFACWERFPCFDSYDYLYENRYYRWFYIRSGNRLTCVYYTDGQHKIEVTEDVKKLKKHCWEAMKEANWQA